MNLRKLILTENACYKAGRTIAVKGIMVHSTGANNPWLKRYVGPDDGQLGQNQYNNHWNTYHPGGREVCVHAFIGKLADGSIATYQTLPWNHRGWHAGGSANNTHIGFEICEDGLTDGTYFDKVYREAVELCAHLCKLYGLTEKNIICHSEGYRQGVASNHGDVMHWFPKHGKSMDLFRADVKVLLEQGDEADQKQEQEPQPEPEPEQEQEEQPTVDAGGEITIGSVVAFKDSAERYNPTTKEIPNWVKKNYNHIVTQTTYRGKPVTKGGKTCVLLGKKVKKSGGEVAGGVNTWTALDNLILIGSTEEDAPQQKADPVPTQRTYTVEKGDTLWGIAKKHLGSGTRYTEIVKLNGLKTSTIYTGQILKLPEK